MKPYSTLRIHSHQSRVHKALVILRNPSTKSDALQLVLRSRGGFQASNETFYSVKSCLDEGSFMIGRYRVIGSGLCVRIQTSRKNYINYPWSPIVVVLVAVYC